ncbi:MAG TPA: DUF6748 domain-containing protein, partial [Pyrinomonadaceae bacterium]|nr:DUF6748 domain-containing protein [Pyrinomonadaceae bacterium]
MKTFRLAVLVLFLAAPVVKTAAPAPETRALATTFYTIRRDVRRCASPMCGGYFIKVLNQSRTRCANGRSMNECYVASIEWNGLPEPDRDGAIVRGQHITKGDRRGVYGVLRASQMWTPASENRPSGNFF